MFKTTSAKKKDRCSFCGQKHPDHMSLDCSHIICLNCLKQAISQNRNKKLVVCQVCKQATTVADDFNKERASRKSHRSTDKKKQEPPPDRNTLTRDNPTVNSKINLPAKQARVNPFLVDSPSAEKQRACNYHFNQKTHVCVTCLRGVCVRCLQTLCQEHKVLSKQKGIQLIKKELGVLYAGKVQETELKLKQLNERKKFYEQRYIKVSEEIHSSFDHIRDVLAKKQQQLIEYCESLHGKIVQQYEYMVEMIDIRRSQLNHFKVTVVNQQNQVQRLRRELMHINSLEELKVDLNYSFELGKIVDESRLERILFEVEELCHKNNGSSIQYRKFRTSTENAERGSLKIFRSIPTTKGLSKDT